MMFAVAAILVLAGINAAEASRCASRYYLASETGWGCPGGPDDVSCFLNSTEGATSPFNVIESAECCNNCTALPDCEVWIHDDRTSQCWLSINNGSQHYFSTQTTALRVPEVQCSSAYSILQQTGWSCPGGAYDYTCFLNSTEAVSSPFQVNDEAQCCANCTAVDDCSIWIYDDRTSQCWLSVSKGTEHSFSTQTTAIRVPTPACHTEYNVVAQTGWSCPGGGDDYSCWLNSTKHKMSPFIVEELEQCCSNCSATHKCDVWIYEENTAQCWLSTASGSKHVFSTQTTALRVPANTCNSSQYKISPETGFSCSGGGYDNSCWLKSTQGLISPFHVDASQECCANCTATDDCGVWVHDASTKQCWLGLVEGTPHYFSTQTTAYRVV